MSKIQQFKPNYSQVPNLANSSVSKSPSFKGSANMKIVDEVVSDLKKDHFSPVGKQGILAKTKGAFMWAGDKVHSFLSETSGETQTQLLNAFFTATLAPFVIKNNPFLKKDEDQKSYAAIRQPISAGIAITGGLAMTKAISDFTDKMTDDGHIKCLDSRLSPTSGYLEKMYNAEYDLVKKDPVKLAEFEKKYMPEGFEEKVANPQTRTDKLLQNRRKNKAMLESFSNGVKKQRKELFTALFGQDPKNLDFNESTKTISLKQADGSLKELAKDIPNLSTKAQFDNYLVENNMHSMKFSNFMNKHYGFETYESGALKGQIKKSSLGKIDQIKAMDFLKEMGFVGGKTTIAGQPLTEETLKIALNKLAQQEGKKEFKEAFRAPGLTLKSDGADMLAEAAGKMDSRTDYSKDVPSLRRLLQRLEHAEKEENLVKLLDMNAADAHEKLAKLLDLKKVGADKFADAIDMAGNLVEKNVSHLARFKTFKGFANIAFNLISTGLTCYALNWTYPRFVEKFFPELVKDKKSIAQSEVKKGGNN